MANRPDFIIIPHFIMIIVFFTPGAAGLALAPGGDRFTLYDTGGHAFLDEKGRIVVTPSPGASQKASQKHLKKVCQWRAFGIQFGF